MHSWTKTIFVEFQRLTLITILWKEETALILWGPKDKTTEVSILLEYGTVSMGIQWPKFLEHYTVSKYGTLITQWKVTYTPRKVHETDQKWVLETSRSSKQGTAARIWYVTRRYKAWQCRQIYLHTSSFITLLWIASPTNRITTQRFKKSLHLKMKAKPFSDKSHACSSSGMYAYVYVDI